MSTEILSECEKEKLHLSGMIQSYGALLVMDPDQRVTHISDNFALMTGMTESIQIGDTLPEEIDKCFTKWPEAEGERSYSFFRTADGRLFDMTISRSGSSVTCEFMPAIDAGLKTKKASFTLPSTIKDSQDLDEIKAKLVLWISERLDHDRVMYYQFLENGDGHVTHEACSDKSMGSYLDLRFPASDIPQIARALYKNNPWREIPDAHSESIGLLGNGSTADLTYVDLRSVSKVHIQYMKNMGVSSSVSFSVVIADELDALISCHSSTPLKIPTDTLAEVSAVINELTLLIRELRARERLQSIDEIDRKTIPIQDLLLQRESIELVWTDLALWLQDYFSADGIVLCSDNWVLTRGKTFESEALDQIDQWFTEECEGLVFHTDSITSNIDSAILSESAGFAAIKFTHRESSEKIRLYCCRQEHIREVKWGGNPNKPTESSTGDLKISPRRSFEKWIEKKLGYSLAWKPSTSLQLHRIRSLFEASTLTFGNTENEL